MVHEWCQQSCDATQGAFGYATNVYTCHDTAMRHRGGFRTYSSTPHYLHDHIYIYRIVQALLSRYRLVRRALNCRPNWIKNWKISDKQITLYGEGKKGAGRVMGLGKGEQKGKGRMGRGMGEWGWWWWSSERPIITKADPKGRAS